MILIAFGSNLPFCGAQPAQILRLACRALGAIVEIRQQSGIYSSPAWPDPTAPVFANAVCEIATGLPAEGLLEVLQSVEQAFGRRRAKSEPPNAPRTLDLDLIAYHNEIIEENGIIVPHPRLADRRFVLAPLAEIAPDWRHPVTGAAANDLLTQAFSKAERVEDW